MKEAPYKFRPGYRKVRGEFEVYLDKIRASQDIRMAPDVFKENQKEIAILNVDAGYHAWYRIVENATVPSGHFIPEYTINALGKAPVIPFTFKKLL